MRDINIITMQTFEVIERTKDLDNEKYFILSAISWQEPIYIKAKTNLNVNVKMFIQVDNGKVFFGNEEIGEVILVKSPENVIINSTYDIKYTGGYSIDGNVIYLDKRLPPRIKVKNKTVSLLESIGKHHELVEKWLIDDGYRYQYAHIIATHVEKQYVESLGVNWNDYDKVIGKLLHINYSNVAKVVPENLDLTPYIHSNDEVALNEIKNSTKNLKVIHL